MLNQRLESLFSSSFQKEAAELKLANYLSKILEIIFLKFLVYPLHAHIPPIKRKEKLGNFQGSTVAFFEKQII